MIDFLIGSNSTRSVYFKSPILGFLIFGLALLLLGKQNLSREVPSQKQKSPQFALILVLICKQRFFCALFFMRPVLV